VSCLQLGLLKTYRAQPERQVLGACPQEYHPLLP
jgi:hypothetical protein